MDNCYQPALVVSHPAHCWTKEINPVFCFRFSSPTSGGEAKPEKPGEAGADSIHDLQENPKVRNWQQLGGSSWLCKVLLCVALSVSDFLLVWRVLGLTQCQWICWCEFVFRMCREKFRSVVSAEFVKLHMHTAQCRSAREGRIFCALF